jgi:hypothetical protein
MMTGRPSGEAGVGVSLGQGVGVGFVVFFTVGTGV